MFFSWMQTCAIWMGALSAEPLSPGVSSVLFNRDLIGKVWTFAAIQSFLRRPRSFFEAKLQTGMDSEFLFDQLFRHFRFRLK